MTKSSTFDIQCDLQANWKGSKEFFGKGSSWFYQKRKVSTLYTHVCESTMLCYETTSGGSTAMHEATSGGSTAMHERTSGETIAA